MKVIVDSIEKLNSFRIKSSVCDITHANVVVLATNGQALLINTGTGISFT